MSDTNLTPSEGKVVRRWLGPALLASLAVNVFLLARISVPLFFGPPHDGGFGAPPRGHGPMLMHGAFKELPEEDRLIFRRAMREQFRNVVPLIRQSREARDALADAIAADPYDEAAVRAAFDDIEKAMDAIGEIGRDGMIEVFARLTPEQRQRVARAMREEQERVRLRWRDRRGDETSPEMMPEGIPGDMRSAPPPAP